MEGGTDGEMVNDWKQVRESVHPLPIHVQLSYLILDSHTEIAMMQKVSNIL